jgi:hypothetical protein
MCVVAVTSSEAAELPVSAAQLPTPAITWLAAGDSYASGQGLTRTTEPCADGTGKNGLGTTWAVAAGADVEAAGTKLAHGGPDLVACTSAISADLLHDNSAKLGVKHKAQWTKSMGRYDLVTFSFGGDDLGFARIVQDCLTSGCPSDASVRAKIAALGSTGLNYKGVQTQGYPAFLESVAKSAVVAGGNIVVMGYPEVVEAVNLWGPDRLTCEGTLTPAKAQLMRGWAGDLNATMGAAVAKVDAMPAAARNGVHVTFVDAVSGSASDGIASNDPNLFEPSSGTRHELCSAGGQVWLNGLSALHVKSRSFHPNQAGETAMGALAAGVIGELSWPWTQSQVPTGTCTTQSESGSPIHQNASIALSPPVTNVALLDMYGDNQGRFSVLAPRGWTCSASIAEDSTEGITLVPPGSVGASAFSTTAAEGVTAEVFPGTDIGDMYQAMCRLFPASVTNAINPSGVYTCEAPALPSTEKDVADGSDAVMFTDPPGVSGTLNNSSGQNSALGVAVFSEKAGNPFLEEAACDLPSAQESTCAAILKNFVARYHSGTTLGASSQTSTTTVPTVASTTTPPTAAPGSSAPCTSSALAAPWLAFGIPDFQPLWTACNGSYALVGGYSANVGFSIALLQQSGSSWAYVAQPNDGTCFAATPNVPNCQGETPWPISSAELDQLVSQAGLALDGQGDVTTPPGWSPPAS